MNKHGESKLSLVAEIFSGYAFKSVDLNTNCLGYPVIKIANIQNKRVLKDCATYLNTSYIKENYKKYFLQKNDVLIAMTGAGSVGKTGKLFDFDDKYLVNQRVAIVRPNISAINPDFLYYFISQDTIENKLYSLGLGAGQPNISPTDIGNVLIPTLSKNAQNITAVILKSYDLLIEYNNKRIKILEEMAQTLYNEWFVHFRFPGHEKVKMVDSELGKIPEGWNIKALGEVVDIKKGRNITKATVVEGEVPVVAAGIDPAYFHNVHNVVAPVVTVSASGANAGYVNLYYRNIWASDCSYINTESTNFLHYLYLVLKLNQNSITGMQKGTAQPHVYPDDLRRFKVVYPPENYLNDFEKIAKGYYQLKYKLLEKNTNLIKTRDILIPKLISGEIDVSEMDI